jgi:protein phosphatase
MGTTMTVALVEPNGEITFGHVGDSRAYLLRGDSLEQLTDDHSLVAELVRRGELSASDAEVHPQRSVITRALGTDPDVDVDAFTIRSEPGDIYLLCSDGLSDMVAGEAIEEVLLRHRSNLDETAKALVRAANRGGGDDNITAVVFEMVGNDAPAPPEPDVPSAVDTMVVPASEVESALAEQEPEVPQAGIGRRLLALLVILGLVALIVVLVWWGLAR